MFSLGKTLFETVSEGKCPFDVATPEDCLYKLIMDKNYKKFWSFFQEKLSDIEAFKDESF